MKVMTRPLADLKRIVDHMQMEESLLGKTKKSCFHSYRRQLLAAVYVRTRY